MADETLSNATLQELLDKVQKRVAQGQGGYRAGGPDPGQYGGSQHTKYIPHPATQ